MPDTRLPPHIIRVEDPSVAGGSYLYNTQTQQPLVDESSVDPSILAELRRYGSIGQAPNHANYALQQIPGHEKWTVVGKPSAGQGPAGVDANGKPTAPQSNGEWTWNIVSPAGETDQFIVDSSGNVLSPPQKTPSTTKRDFSVSGPDANGKYWAVFNDDPTHPQEIEGPNGKQGSAGGRAFQIKADSNGQDWVYYNDDPEHPRKVNAGPPAKSETPKTMTDYEKASIALQQRKAAADAAAQASIDNARQVEADTRKILADSTITHERAMEVIAQQEAALNQANQALTAQRDANTAWYQHQEAELANKTFEQNSKNQGDQTAIQAAQGLETNRHNLAQERGQAGVTGAGLLNDRATHATGLLNNWVNAAAGNKNFGLGGALPSGLGAGLMSDAGGFATQMMGGQSVMDDAAAMVHAANPSLQGTPEGSQYTAILAQMLEKHKTQMNPQQEQQQQPQQDQQPQQPQQQSQQPDPNTIVGGTPDRMGESRMPTNPSDPNFLGKAIAAAMVHFDENRNAGEENFRGRPTTNLPHFAGGTWDAPGGPSVVGERGPEVVNLPRGSQVYPMDNANSTGFSKPEEPTSTGAWYNPKPIPTGPTFNIQPMPNAQPVMPKIQPMPVIQPTPGLTPDPKPMPQGPIFNKPVMPPQFNGGFNPGFSNIQPIETGVRRIQPIPESPMNNGKPNPNTPVFNKTRIQPMPQTPIKKTRKWM